MYLKENKTEMWLCHTLNGQLEPRTSCGLDIITTYMNHMRYTAVEGYSCLQFVCSQLAPTVNPNHR